MKQIQKWKDVVQSVELSGLSTEEALKRQNLQRNAYIKKQLQEHISLAESRKKQLNQIKIEDRQKVESLLISQLEKEKRARSLTREGEKLYRQENLNLMNAQNQNLSQLIHYPEQNPITYTLSKQNMIRKEQRRKQNESYNNENLKIIQNKLAEKQRERSNMNQQGTIFLNHIQSSYVQRERDQRKFQMQVLERGNPSELKVNRQVSEADSIPRQYSQYLQNQINHKRRRMQTQTNSTLSKIEDSLDNQLEKINQNLQLQSASPAYLGRIPCSSDRKKQLQYLCRQTNRHQRIKTELPTLTDFTSNRSKNNQKIVDLELQVKSIAPLRLEIQKKGEVKTKQRDDREQKVFRLYNIINGNTLSKYLG